MPIPPSRILVVGTNNVHKAGEISPLLDGLGLTLRPAGVFGPFDPHESGRTLEENALIKARAALALSGEWSIADDTGLEVDALGGRPGIHAARYAGPGCSFADNICKLLGELAGVPEEKRGARFACLVALCRPDAQPEYFRGEIAGRILEAPRGAGGFGYDPVFFLPSLGRTFAELALAEKNRLSHRALAAGKLRAWLEG
jgi:XTP/dITP diphosphohydrolase